MKKTDVTKSKVREEMTFLLTPKERSDRMTESLALEEQIAKANKEISDFRSTKKAEIQTITSTRNKVRRELSSNERTELVTVTEEKDFTTGTVRYIYAGAKPKTRQLTDSERQEPLKLTAKKTGKKKKNVEQNIQAPTAPSKAHGTTATA